MTEATETGMYFEWRDGGLHPYDPGKLRYDDEDTNDEWSKKHGYRLIDQDGHLGLCLEVYMRDGEGHPFIAVLCLDGSKDQYIFITSFDGLLRFKALIAPLMTQRLLEETLESLTGTANKAFRAWHGHYSEAMCDRCDPRAMKQWDDASKALKKKEVTPFIQPWVRHPDKSERFITYPKGLEQTGKPVHFLAAQVTFSNLEWYVKVRPDDTGLYSISEDGRGPVPFRSQRKAEEAADEKLRKVCAEKGWILE